MNLIKLFLLCYTLYDVFRFPYYMYAELYFYSSKVKDADHEPFIQFETKWSGALTYKFFSVSFRHNSKIDGINDGD